MKNKKRLKILVLLFLCLVATLVIYLNYSTRPFIEKNQTTEIECVTDKECGVGGCSGEVCTTLEKAEEIITPCIWRPEYGCLKLTSCRCTKGNCNWEENQAYRECIEAIK